MRIGTDEADDLIINVEGFLRLEEVLDGYALFLGDDLVDERYGIFFS